MATSHHQRSESSESNSSAGSAYQLILDHILTYPGSYEIPLRTMYTLNSAPRAQPTHSGSHSPSSSEGSPTSSQGPFSDNGVTKSFNESLMAQLSQLPHQPTSLPPSFINSFVRRCFAPVLEQVDFPQALTGLDYLKDLEKRRRREVAAAMNRLDVHRETLDSSDDRLSDRFPGVAQWVKAIESKERKVDALYTQLYVGLRRWILINELSLLPFNKHNCYAMLNTLYPPVVSAPPTSRLTSSILKNQRDGFMKYIQSVEKNGPCVLFTLMHQGKSHTDVNGWTAVTRTLGMYLQLANSMIDECVEITDVQSVSPRKAKDSTGEKTPRKVDSGVSFSLSERSSSRSNSLAEPAAAETVKQSVARPETARPDTPTGSMRTVTTVRSRATSSSKHGTTLERIARGLRTIGRNRTDATEMIPENDRPPQPVQEKSKTLRKMKSMGNLDSRSGSNGDLSSSLKPRQQQPFYEAGVLPAQKYGTKQSHEV